MDTVDLHYQRMTKTPVWKLVVRLGIPTTVSMLITSIYNLADTYFLGTLGESQQAATGVLFTLQCIIQAIAFMLGHGSGSYVARSLADKDVDKATEYVSTAFFTGLTFGLTLTLLGFALFEPFLYLLGSSATILPYAKQYGMWVLISAPIMIGSLVLNNNLRYEGKAFFAMIGLTTGGLLNILGDYLLIVVADLGVFGAGLSTALSQTVSFTILLVLYLKRAQSTISFKHVARRLQTYSEIVKVGFPSLLRQGLTAFSNGLLNNLARGYGDAAIDAMSVVNRYSAFVMCVGLGIGQGFQPVASFNYRAKEYTRVKQALLFTIALGFALVGALDLVGLLIPDKIVYLFQKEEEVVKIGTFAMRMAAFGTLLLPLSVPVNMLYQSIQKAGVASFLSLLRSGLMFIPVLLITEATLGLTGVQISQPIADILTGLICVPFILHFLIKTPNTQK